MNIFATNSAVRRAANARTTELSRARAIEAVKLFAEFGIPPEVVDALHTLSGVGVRVVNHLRGIGGYRTTAATVGRMTKLGMIDENQVYTDHGKMARALAKTRVEGISRHQLAALLELAKVARDGGAVIWATPPALGALRDNYLAREVHTPLAHTVITDDGRRLVASIQAACTALRDR